MPFQSQEEYEQYQQACLEAEAENAARQAYDTYLSELRQTDEISYCIQRVIDALPGENDSEILEFLEQMLMDRAKPKQQAIKTEHSNSNNELPF